MKIIEIPVNDILTAFFLGIYLKIVFLQLKPFYIYILYLALKIFNCHVKCNIQNTLLYH